MKLPNPIDGGVVSLEFETYVPQATDLFAINTTTGTDGAMLHLSVFVLEKGFMVELGAGHTDGHSHMGRGLDDEVFNHLSQRNPFFLRLKEQFPNFEEGHDGTFSPHIRFKLVEDSALNEFLRMTDEWFSLADPNS